jgi:hypothetical protein
MSWILQNLVKGTTHTWHYFSPTLDGVSRIRLESGMSSINVGCTRNCLFFQNTWVCTWFLVGSPFCPIACLLVFSSVLWCKFMLLIYTYTSVQYDNHIGRCPYHFTVTVITVTDATSGEKLLTFPEHLSSFLLFSGAHIAQSLVFCVVFCQLSCLSFCLFLPLYPLLSVLL